MALSHIQFAQAFERLKAELAATPAGDLQLIRLVRFWPTLQPGIDSPLYSTYVDEYVAVLEQLVTEANLQDLTIAELERLREMAVSVSSRSVSSQSFPPSALSFPPSSLSFPSSSLSFPRRRESRTLDPTVRGGDKHTDTARRSGSGITGGDKKPDKLPTSEGQMSTSAPPAREAQEPVGPDPQIVLITRRLARLYAYIGETEKAVLLCAEIAGEDIQGLNLSYDTRTLNEFQALCFVRDQLADMDLVSKPEAGFRPTEGTQRTVQSIIDEWEAERDHLWFDRVRCLFVERDGHGRAVRGRMRTLVGSVDTLRRKNRSGVSAEVTFHNQIVAPDDPFVGVVYDALEAIRLMQRPHRTADRSEEITHAHYQIEDANHTFTGDSIGLAAGLVAYTQLLKPEIMRHERFVSSEVAFTGGLAEDGRLSPVNGETLRAKIERAFFSPVKYLVLPEENMPRAQEILKDLTSTHPHRRLRIESASHLTDVIENHNIVRAEKVCLGEFVARKTYRYARMTKLQAPLLAALLWVLLAILFPKVFDPWFDWNPRYIEIFPNRVVAMNNGKTNLWHVEISRLVPYEIDTVGSRVIVSDFDGDDMNEALLALSPRDYTLDSSFCKLIKLDDDGLTTWDTMFTQNPTIGQVSQPNHYHFRGYENWYALIDLACGDTIKDVVLMVREQREYSFCQIITFDPINNKVEGSYWHRGVLTGWTTFDLFSDGHDDLLFAGISNEHGRAALFAFNSDKLDGLMPPHKDSLGRMGTQIFYALLPKTEIAKIELSTLHQASLKRPGRDLLEAMTIESSYNTGGLFYTFDDKLHVRSIIPSSSYLSYVNEFWQTNQQFDSTFLFRVPSVEEITYFDGERFVNYWTICHPISQELIRSLEKASK